uniref:CCHC-type domain-containing protein n=1 Tax=Ditylenchus dipsaci TaxID=166011 RepID=A0A915DYE0_9BILA
MFMPVPATLVEAIDQARQVRQTLDGLEDSHDPESQAVIANLQMDNTAMKLNEKMDNLIAMVQNKHQIQNNYAKSTPQMIPRTPCPHCCQLGHWGRDCPIATRRHNPQTQQLNSQRNATCSNCRSYGHTENQCQLRVTQQNGKSFRTPTCYTCGVIGHTSPNCWTKRQNGAQPNTALNNPNFTPLPTTTHQGSFPATSQTISPSTSAGTSQHRRTGNFHINSIMPILMLLVMFGNFADGQYQICMPDLPGIAVPAPTQEDCRLPPKDQSSHRNITLYLPRRSPMKFKVWSCLALTTHRCAASGLQRTMGTAPTMRHYRLPTSKSLCEILMTDLKTPEGEVLVRQEETVWKTKTPLKSLLTVQWFWQKPPCSNTTNYELQEGTGIIMNGKLTTTLRATTNCTYNHLHCTDNQGYLLFILPDESYAFTHDPLETEAFIFNNRVRVDSIEAVFKLTNRTHNRNTTRGVPYTAKKLDKDAYMIIHNKRERRSALKANKN